jgi:hypothetical protein
VSDPGTPVLSAPGTGRMLSTSIVETGEPLATLTG